MITDYREREAMSFDINDLKNRYNMVCTNINVLTMHNRVQTNESSILKKIDAFADGVATSAQAIAGTNLEFLDVTAENQHRLNYVGLVGCCTAALWKISACFPREKIRRWLNNVIRVFWMNVKKWAFGSNVAIAEYFRRKWHNFLGWGRKKKVKIGSIEGGTMNDNLE
ncbi:hypothetical protein NCAS_0I03080 [Naumovozyma castellii]|uniref:Uncharacterized protein n=1 Tax=Naumovozyma castellii TaxID=27288 RepID=G0VKE2_NAUCA|nr:hypothetical protein NCAS_0I03080 [Naumovozyma castellii CBS 4309]CCC71976.1 hypothetical protein NCAS_0I03080 [Naumovozyma castellii CBS 4309]